MEIMEYKKFKQIFNETIFEKSKADLLEKIANSPTRYIGLFRPTKPKAKILQNLLQSHEIRFGDAFEHFIINQCIQLASYRHRNYRFTYLATKDDAEIDLVVERPGQKILFIEIKSTTMVERRHLSTLKTLAHDFGDCEVICLSRDQYIKNIDDIRIYPWEVGIKKYFFD